MDNDSYNLVKALVATVARAFYTDPYIVLLDTLFRETVMEKIYQSLHGTYLT